MTTTSYFSRRSKVAFALATIRICGGLISTRAPFSRG
ncbi:hypothetical protein X975_19532, partial [Stegodyphus mimosarum]